MYLYVRWQWNVFVRRNFAFLMRQAKKEFITNLQKYTNINKMAKAAGAAGPARTLLPPHLPFSAPLYANETLREHRVEFILPRRVIENTGRMRNVRLPNHAYAPCIQPPSSRGLRFLR